MIATSDMEDVKTMLAGFDDEIDYDDFGPAQDSTWPLGGKSKRNPDSGAKNRAADARLREIRRVMSEGHTIEWVMFNRRDLFPNFKPTARKPKPGALPRRQFVSAPTVAAPSPSPARMPDVTTQQPVQVFPPQPSQPVQDDPFFTRTTPSGSIPMPMGYPGEGEDPQFSPAPTFDTPAQMPGDDAFFGDNADPYASEGDDNAFANAPDGYGGDDLGGGFFGKILRIAAPVAGGIFGGPAGAAAGMAVGGALSSKKKKRGQAAGYASPADDGIYSSPRPSSGSGGLLLLLAGGGVLAFVLSRKR